MSAIPFKERISCTVDEACSATGIGRSKLYSEIAAGRVDTRKVGKRTLIVIKSLLKLFGNEDSATSEAA
jgi:excisionase family DNA binding protein